jgi:hypothetical protein
MASQTDIIDIFAKKFDGSSTRIGALMEEAFDRALAVKADAFVGVIVNQRTSDVDGLALEIQLLESTKARVTEALKTRGHS